MSESYVGHKFSRWLVLGQYQIPDKKGWMRWNCFCRCDCGTEKVLPLTRLKCGDTRSCGCLRREKLLASAIKHGGNGSKAHACWMHMRSRCNNPNDPAYEHYGARGIKVCAEWDDFVAFLNHIGPPPSDKHTVDRIDVNDGYVPGNVRWATLKEQNRNRRDNIYAEVDGVRLCLKDAAEALGINYGTVKGRINRGWEIQRALSAPLSPPGRPGPRAKVCNPPFNR